MKARIPKHREFIIDFPQSMDQAKADEGWAKLNEIVEEYKKAHNGQSVYSATFIEDCEPAVKKLQEEYGFNYTCLLYTSFEGVESSYAVQAGREVRILVQPDKVSDDQVILLARNVAKKIENELDYPGQIKVSVIRESRATEYAK